MKAVDGDGLLRLTNTPKFHEALPSWSPDGRQIAFQRAEATINRGVYLVSPLGGHEQKVVDIGGIPSWTPDSRALVMGGRTAAGLSAIFEHVLETGERRQLTSPPPGFTDQYPKVSPDGTMLAFARMSVIETPGRGSSCPWRTPWPTHGQQRGERTGPSHRLVPVRRAAGLDAGRPRDSLPENGIRRRAGVSCRRLGWTTASGHPGSPSRSTCSSIAVTRDGNVQARVLVTGKWTSAFGSSICSPRQQKVQSPAPHRSVTRREGTCPDGSLRRGQRGIHIRPRNRFGGVAGRTHGGMSPTCAQPSSLGGECRLLVARRPLRGAGRSRGWRVRHLCRRR